MNAFVICMLTVTVVATGSPITSSGYDNNYKGNGYQGNSNNYPQQQYSTGYQQSSTQYPATSSSYSNQNAYGSNNNYVQQSSYGGYGSTSYYPQAKLYQGRYYGSCSQDGFYYNDVRSLVFCSNGIPYVQQCAPGSINSDAGSYAVGVATYSSFCNVNQVDTGAGASYGSGYGSNSYSNGDSYGKSYGASSSNYGNNNYAVRSYQRSSYQPIYPQQPVAVYAQSYNSNGYTNSGSSY